jgi:hypothetical protein
VALLSAYITAEEYIRRTAGQGGIPTDILEAELLGCSRLLERSLQWAPGMGNTHTATYTFTANAAKKLRLRDSDERQYFLQSVVSNGIGVDSDGDGTFDGYALDLADTWVRAYPENAAALGEPYTSLVIAPLTGGSFNVWPAGLVRINGTWGWATVPEIIKALTAFLTRDLRNGLLAEPSADSIPAIEEGMPLSNDTRYFWNLARSQYRRRLLGVA